MTTPTTAAPGLAQAERARARRGARGEDVVDDDDVTPGHQVGSAERERIAHIGPALRRGEIGLGTGRGGPSQHVRRGPARSSRGQAAREQERLVEAPLPLAPGVQRHGDEQVGRRHGQTRRPHLDHEIGERRGERAAPGELERAQGLAQRGPRIGRPSAHT